MVGDCDEQGREQIFASACGEGKGRVALRVLGRIQDQGEGGMRIGNDQGRWMDLVLLLVEGGNGMINMLETMFEERIEVL